MDALGNVGEGAKDASRLVDAAKPIHVRQFENARKKYHAEMKSILDEAGSALKKDTIVASITRAWSDALYNAFKDELAAAVKKLDGILENESKLKPEDRDAALAEAVTKVKSFYDALVSGINAKVDPLPRNKTEAIEALKQTVLTTAIAPLLAKARGSLTRYENAITTIGDTNP
jgi:predicted RecB family endonuclease